MTEFINDVIKWCNENQGFLMALLTGVYVLATIILVWTARHANELAESNVRSLTKIEEERLRPFVEVRLECDEPFVVLRVSNNGQTPAYNIRFEVDPELQMVLGGEGSHPSGKTMEPIGIIETGIGSLGSGTSESTLVGMYSRVREEFPDMRFTGTVCYQAVNGATYSTPVDLDLRFTEGALDVHRKSLHDVANQLEKIEKELRHIGSGFHKLQVVTQTAEQEKAKTDEFLAAAALLSGRPNRHRRRKLARRFGLGTMFFLAAACLIPIAKWRFLARFKK